MIGRPVSVFNCLSSVAVFFILWPRYVTCQDADTPGCWSGNAPLEKGQLTKVSNCSCCLTRSVGLQLTTDTTNTSGVSLC